MPYRFEESPTSRAGCTNKECKDAIVKITKGELRVGSWVDTGNFQTYYWRHWGCLTPKMIENIQQAYELGAGSDSNEDYDVLDGYNDLSEEYQAKVRKALQQGHVDDDDWNGDAELNRPGKIGFRIRTPKKKAAKNAADKQEEKDEENASPTKKRSLADTNTKDEEEKLPKAKKPTRRKNAVDDEDADSDASAAAPPPKKGRRAAKAKAKASNGDNDDGEAEEKPMRMTRARKAKAENDDNVEYKPKRGRKARTK